MGTEYYQCLTVVPMKGNSKQIALKVTAISNGRMRNSMKDSGKIILCMVKAYLYGQMVENTMASTKKAKKKGLDSSYGPMAESIGDSGKIASRMAEEYLLLKTAKKGQASGATAAKSDGLIDTIL